MVVNPATSVKLLEPILHLSDIVLIMSVNPGFGGQTFLTYTLEKINWLKEFREQRNLNYKIEVDGGINKETIIKATNAGCDIFVAGSAIFNSENITASTTELKNLII